MSFFSRNKEALEAVRADDTAFDAPRPRGARRRAADEDDPGPRLDPTHTARTRARRRLIGAVALALAAVVFVPMLFDRTPVAPVDDISVQIPDRDSPFEGRRGVPDPARGPLRPSSATPTVAPAPDTTVAPSSSAASGKLSTADPPAMSATSLDHAQDKTPESPVVAAVDPVPEKGIDKPKAADKPKADTPADDPRALAALEGKSASAAASGKGFAVQVAALSSSDKARSLRDQLAANGLKAYAEPLSTPQGERTRVRVGPFPDRESADRARQKLRTMKLDGSVVAL